MNKNKISNTLSEFVPDFKIYADNQFQIIDFDQNLKNELINSSVDLDSIQDNLISFVSSISYFNHDYLNNYNFANDLINFLVTSQNKSALLIINGKIHDRYPALYLFVITVERNKNLNIINIYNPLLLASKIKKFISSNLISNLYNCISSSIFTEKNVNLAKSSLQDLFLLFNENPDPISSSRKWFSELLYLFHEPKKISNRVDLDIFYKDLQKEDGIKSKYKQLLEVFGDRKSVDAFYDVRHCIPFNKCSANQIHILE